MSKKLPYKKKSKKIHISFKYKPTFFKKLVFFEDNCKFADYLYMRGLFSMEELLEQLLKDAIALHVTDLHFKSLYDSQIYMRLNNQIQPFKKMNLDVYGRLVTYLKYKAQLDYNRLSFPQTGSFKLILGKNMYYFRLSYLPSPNDIHLVLRILNHENPITFDMLTEKEDDKTFFRKLLKKEAGLIIVCGPTGSGKSTTLHCFLEEIRQTTHKNIVTIEDPIEIYLKDTIQMQINEAMGLTFENILMQVLRHDPDVVMIGELRNEHTAKIALKLALTGHLVLTTLHASDGKSALKRLISLELQEDDLKEILLCIITQRLFYTKQENKPFVIFEILDKQNIRSTINNDVLGTISLFDKIKKAYEEGKIKEDEYEKYA